MTLALTLHVTSLKEVAIALPEPAGRLHRGFWMAVSQSGRFHEPVLCHLTC